MVPSSLPIANQVWAQNFSCESFEQYVDQHPDCYIQTYSYEPCLGISCSDRNGSMYIYSSFDVHRCQDPVTVYVYGSVRKDGRFYFSHQFDQSETVDTNGYYYGSDYYYHDDHQNISSYTAILDRNFTHLGFEVTNEHVCLTYAHSYIACVPGSYSPPVPVMWIHCVNRLYIYICHCRIFLLCICIYSIVYVTMPSLITCSCILNQMAKKMCYGSLIPSTFLSFLLNVCVAQWKL